MEDFSELLLHLYRMSRELPVEQFQDAALGLLRSILRFDSGYWGTGLIDASGLHVNSVHTCNFSPDFWAAYEEVKARDLVAPLVLERVGRTVNWDAARLFNGRANAAMRGHAMRFEACQGLSTTVMIPELGIMTFTSLYRADPSRSYSEDERRFVEAVMPHLAEALNLNRALHLPSLAAEPGAGRNLAIVDRQGVIYNAEPEFFELALLEWPDFRGLRIPADMLACFAAGGVYAGRQITLSARPVDDLLVVRGRWHTRLDELSPRERVAAGHYGQGLQHKEVARAMGCSPATARKHLQNAYRKLGVSDKAELARLLDGHREASAGSPQ